MRVGSIFSYFTFLSIFTFNVFSSPSSDEEFENDNAKDPGKKEKIFQNKTVSSNLKKRKTQLEFHPFKFPTAPQSIPESHLSTPQAFVKLPPLAFSSTIPTTLPSISQLFEDSDRKKSKKLTKQEYLVNDILFLLQKSSKTKIFGKCSNTIIDELNKAIEHSKNNFGLLLIPKWQMIFAILKINEEESESLLEKISRLVNDHIKSECVSSSEEKASLPVMAHTQQMEDGRVQVTQSKNQFSSSGPQALTSPSIFEPTLISSFLPTLAQVPQQPKVPEQDVSMARATTNFSNFSTLLLPRLPIFDSLPGFERPTLPSYHQSRLAQLLPFAPNEKVTADENKEHINKSSDFLKSKQTKNLLSSVLEKHFPFFTQKNFSEKYDFHCFANNEKIEIFLPKNLNKQNFFSLKIIDFLNDADLSSIKEFRFKKARLPGKYLKSLIFQMLRMVELEKLELDFDEAAKNELTMLANSILNLKKLTELTLKGSILINEVNDVLVRNLICLTHLQSLKIVVKGISHISMVNLIKVIGQLPELKKVVLYIDSKEFSPENTLDFKTTCRKAGIDFKLHYISKEEF